jgi:glutathione S-transferase
MSPRIVFYELAPSPNNMKVRLALNYKELPFETVPVDPVDRAPVVKVSGQPLTPVLLHGETVVFDSASILRYLDGNFRHTPRLFSEDYNTMKAIEEAEVQARRDLGEPIRMVFRQFWTGKPDPAVGEAASRLLNQASAGLEKRLSESAFLVGSTLTAADLFTAPLIHYGVLTPTQATANAVTRFFAQHLALGEGRDRTRAWVDRIWTYMRP